MFLSLGTLGGRAAALFVRWGRGGASLSCSSVRILFVVSGGVLALIGLGGRVGAEFGAELNCSS